MSIECTQERVSEREAATEYHLESGESVSVAVVEAVARASGRSAVPDADETEALSPLYEAVEPDAIDDLFGPESRFEGCLTFTYCAHTVQIDSSGRIRVDGR